MFAYENKDLFDELLDAYGEHLIKQGKSHVAVSTYQNANRKLIRFVKEKGIAKPKKITNELLEEFQLFLYQERDFTEKTVETAMKHVKLFFDFLILIGRLKKNIARKTELVLKPEPPQQQLKHHFTFEEAVSHYLKAQEKWVSFSYLNNVRKHLKGFFRYLLMIEVGSIYSITEGTLLRYRDFLWDEFVQNRTNAIVVKGQIERLRCIVKLFRYLQKEGILKENPAQNLEWEGYYKDILERAKTLPEYSEPNNDLTELDELRQKFLDYELVKGKDKRTVSLYKRNIGIFFDFLRSKGIENLAQIDKRQLLEYYAYISNYVNRHGNPATRHYQARMIWSVKVFFRFLARFDFIAKDPSMDLETIREETGLPRNFMNEKEVFELLDKPKLNHNPLILRDKTIMEVLFASAIRSDELCQLNIEDVDQYEGMLRINKPKGGKNYQRIVPICDATVVSIDLYLREARPKLTVSFREDDYKALFLSYRGRRINTEAVLSLVKKYAYECGFRKNITTHSFRVSCATLLLKNGAGIKHVQEMLGHRNINSTQIYTRLAPLDLKKAHQKYHPLERKYYAGKGEKQDPSLET